jgi:hypothetical protein
MRAAYAPQNVFETPCVKSSYQKDHAQNQIEIETTHDTEDLAEKPLWLCTHPPQPSIVFFITPTFGKQPSVSLPSTGLAPTPYYSP